VTLGHGEGWDTGGGDGRDGGKSSLGDVDTSVPVAPGLVGVEHSTASTHVTESSGTRSGGTTTSDTGNTSNSSASSPRLGGSLFTSSGGDSVWLSGVLGDVGVDELDDISSDRSLEDGWEVDLFSGGRAISAVNGNYWSSSSHWSGFSLLDNRNRTQKWDESPCTLR